MKTKRRFKELEKQLKTKHKDMRENEVVLDKSDFKDGKLSFSGFKRLKQECEYVDYNEDIEIKIPKEFENGFKDCLEFMATKELSHIRKDKRESRILAVIFLTIGVAVLAFGALRFVESFIRMEITIIVAWVFVWAASEKLFFDRRDLQNWRYNLLHILSAKVVTY